ncbi:hypothetical protein [Pseudonocardia sp. HH130630-07]|uniref:hypothetical protein n=1 Tax=Pseudonocardia sp. HH130630-07 TaxID=1690815 RepID=UPI000814CF42|nr:hypothetical protein [Pseudonocardia sp. HH130630-07]ANY07558.1 hypothetical protein AFB00_16075 [Pseudonocardia sp. HH130630-07]
MALGLFDESRGGRTMLGHGGDTAAFHALMQIHPGERIGVVVAMNGNGNDGLASSQLRNAVLDGFTDRYVPGPERAAPQEPAPGAEERVAAAAGRYESARASFSTFVGAANLLGQVTVTPGPDGTLISSPGVGRAGPTAYREIRPWVWQEIGGEQVLAARHDGDRVTAIGAESAFTLLRAAPLRDAAIVLPVLVGALVALVAGLAAWPVGALARRRYGVAAAGTGRADRAAIGLTRLATGCAVLAAAAWSATVLAVMGLADPPRPLLYAVLAAQWVATGGVLAAAVALVTGFRAGVGRARLAGRVLMLLGLVGVAWVALAFGLLSPDLGY